MIMSNKSRVEGCLEYLKLAIRQNKEDFARFNYSIIFKIFIIKILEIWILTRWL